MKDHTLSDRECTDLYAPAFTAFFAICAAWAVDEELQPRLLGEVDRKDFHSWRDGGVESPPPILSGELALY